MTPKQIQDVINMSGMLQYIGCRDISTVLNTIYFWDFPKSITEGFIEYGSLTDRQKNAMINLVEKHTGVECKPCLEGRIEHEVQYESNQPEKALTIEPRAVQHNFDELSTIQLFDLPLETGDVKSYLFYPYSKHNLVVQISGKFYKIPNPENFDKISEPTTIKFKYKRTKVKGFCEQIKGE